MNRTHALDLTGKKHQESRSESTALEYQQPAKVKKTTQSKQKTPTKGDKKTLQEGRETSTSLSYPKGSIEKGEEKPLKR